MKIGLIDVDSHHFPSLPLMKLSAWHKKREDTVEWYNPLMAWRNPYDMVYMSKVFSFTPDYPHPVCAQKVIRGGTGYFYPEGGPELLPEIEQCYPDYRLYPELTRHTAYGFLTRGCPRGCGFCIVKGKEGMISRKVADLSDFWDGQKEIKLLDPNILACREWKGLLQQLVDSGAWVDFTQGLDIRLMSPEKAAMLQGAKVKRVHFAWDDYRDKNIILPKLKEFRDITGWDHRKMGVYILTNYNTTLEQDLERVYTLREMGYAPYIMIYEKEKVKRGSDLRRLQRWVNSRAAFAAVDKFEDFK